MNEMLITAIVLAASTLIVCQGMADNHVRRRQAVVEALSTAHQVAASRITHHEVTVNTNQTKHWDQAKQTHGKGVHSNLQKYSNFTHIYKQSLENVQQHDAPFRHGEKFRPKTMKNMTLDYRFLSRHGATFGASKVYVPLPFHINVKEKESKESKENNALHIHSKPKPSSMIKPTQTSNIHPTNAAMKQPSTDTKYIPTQTTFIDRDGKKTRTKTKYKCRGRKRSAVERILRVRNAHVKDVATPVDKVLCHGASGILASTNTNTHYIKDTTGNPLFKGRAINRSIKSNGILRPAEQRQSPPSRKSQPNYGMKMKQKHSRKKRQTMFSQDLLGQQLLQSLSAQPVLPDTQQVFGGLLGDQTARSDVAGNPLIGQTQQLLSPVLQQQDPFSLVQTPLEQQQQLQLSQFAPDQSNFPLVSSPIDPLNSLGYQGGQVLPVPAASNPWTGMVPGQTRQSIPLVPQSNYGAQYEDDYFREPRRRRRRKPHRRHYLYRPESYRSFEDTYGKSPGIFDDLKEIGSQIGQYDDDNYGQRFVHRRHHRHRQRGWAEGRGSRVEEDADRRSFSHREPTDTYDMPERDEEETRDDFTDKYTGGDEHQEVESDGDMEHKPLTDENIQKPSEVGTHQNKERHQTAEKTSQDKEKEVEYVHNNTADAFAVQETSEAELKRKVILNRLDKDAVMHLDFDVTSQKNNVVQDASPNGNDAELTNGAAITSKRLGTCGRGAILKKGEVSYRGKDFKRKPKNAVSIAMWVKSKSSGFIRWFDQGNAGHKSSFFASTKSPAVPKKRWTHLAGSFDSKTGETRIYVDGQLKLEKVGRKNEGLPQDFTSAGIGRKFADDHVTFLDDVYMFDRVIAPEEVTSLYRKCEFNRMVLHYGFQHWNTSTKRLDDQSGLQNNATLRSGAHVVTSGCDKCGACLDLSSGDEAEVFLDSSHYKRKPTSAVSVSAWVSLNRTSGLHSIFQALKGKTENTNLYNLEIIDGKVHWQTKNKNGKVLFDVLTKEVTIPEGLWTHVTGTYNSQTGSANIYVNGLRRGSFTNPSRPKLTGAWGRATIGGHIPDHKPFMGLVDEFFMYNWELDPSEARFVLKYCAEKPKLVSFTVKVPIL